ncbi:MAG TPA: LysM domain-containing protein [Aeromicrobium sp.]|nr:LysM domain-containing protein [Aeromicrobium sp.]
MGFWSRVKDVLASGPTTAVKNERAEDAAERARERAQQAPPQKAEVPPPPAPEAPAPDAPIPAPTGSAPQADAPPAAPEGASAEPEYRTYTVKSGDTLSEIAAQYGVDWHEMARLNDLENPDLIFPGQVFKVPNK